MAMTDSELIATCVAATSDAREVLEKLRDFAQDTGDITFTLSGGATITVTALQTLIENLLKDMLGSEEVALTYDGNNLVSQIVRTLESGNTVTKDYTYNSDLMPVTITTTLKDSGGTTIWSTSRTLTYLSDGRLDAIS